MAEKKYMSYENLQEYDALIKAKIDAGDAVFEDRIVATDEAELTSEIGETFGGHTADEYALKSEIADMDISGIPDGGTTNQILAKQSDADGDAVWVDALAWEKTTNTITWDGNITDRPSIYKNNQYYYRVAETNVVTNPQPPYFSSVNKVKINDAWVSVAETANKIDGMYLQRQYYVIVFDEAIAGYPRGIYLIDGITEATASYPIFVDVKQIDEKFIPNSYVHKTSIAGGTAGQYLTKASGNDGEFAWTDPLAYKEEFEVLNYKNTDYSINGRNFYQATDIVPPRDVLLNNTIRCKRSGVDVSKKLTESSISNGAYVYSGVFYIVFDADLFGHPCGIYLNSAVVDFTIDNYKFVKSIKHIDEEYIPDTIARKSDIPEVKGMPVLAEDGADAGKTIKVNESGTDYELVENVGGGVSSWNDLTDKPFYDESEILYEGYPEFAFSSAKLGNIPLREGVTYAIGYDDDANVSHVEYYTAKMLYGTIKIDATDRVDDPFMLTYNENDKMTYLENVGGVYSEGCPETDPEGIYAYKCKVKMFIMYKDFSDVGVVPLDGRYLPKAEAVADVTEAPTAEDFNALLASLRNAGYLATE